jgi:uncharacterized membrane protein
VTQTSEALDALASRAAESNGRGQEPAPATPAKQSWWRRPWMIPLGIVLVAFLLWSLPPYLTFDPAQSRSRTDGFPGHYAALQIHIATGTIAMVAAFFQVWPWFRRRFRKTHRWLGHAYVWAGVLPTTLAALLIIPFTGLPTGTLGGATSAVAWIATTIAGLRAARQGRYHDHRRWMIYSFALAYNIVFGRALFITLALIPGLHVDGHFVPGLQYVETALNEAGGWMGSVINLLIAYWWIRRTENRPRDSRGEEIRQPRPTQELAPATA